MNSGKKQSNKNNTTLKIMIPDDNEYQPSNPIAYSQIMNFTKRSYEITTPFLYKTKRFFIQKIEGIFIDDDEHYSIFRIITSSIALVLFFIYIVRNNNFFAVLFLLFCIVILLPGIGYASKIGKGGNLKSKELRSMINMALMIFTLVLLYMMCSISFARENYYENNIQVVNQ